MEEIKQLDEKGLREFGLLTGTIIIALFGLKKITFACTDLTTQFPVADIGILRDIN